MASGLDLKVVLAHLANGTICENLCRICLKPLTDDCENIFTMVCKDSKEYCIADVLKELCNIQISETDHYNVCSECFIVASNAYKFYLNTKCNDKLLHYYADELENYLKSIDMTQDALSGESICISLPVLSMETETFDYNVNNIEDIKWSKKNFVQSINKEEIKIKSDHIKTPHKDVKQEKKDKNDDEIIIVMNENGQPAFYKMQLNGVLQKVDYNLKKKASEVVSQVSHKKRKKREPMTAKTCMRCPIKYRFIAKLQEHMKMVHGVILYSCKVCQALTEDEEFHKFHVKTHTNVFQCDICSVRFKKREAIINHMKNHNQSKDQSSKTEENVCLQCGLIFEDDTSLSHHFNVEHYKKLACYYCGRVYKVKESFNKHIEKHEKYMKLYEEKHKQQDKRSFTTAEAKQLIASSESQGNQDKGFTCELCGRGFRGARALLWHRRLHTNERPFECETCGRAFVSLNRRNQHALCAHSPPARRCPLCPARFHLRSMVNTHVKKVHLKAHKRRTRAVAASADSAATPVPVQELSVAIQQDILELQAQNTRDDDEEERGICDLSPPAYFTWDFEK